MNNIIKMQSSPEVVAAKRKEACDLDEPAPPILPSVKATIAERFERGVKMSALASEYRLGMRQIERIVRESRRNPTPPTITAVPTVLQAKRLHVISRRLAA
jgi:hypothetical protein